MATTRSLLSHEVTDLCLGKPAGKPIPCTATLSTALSLLRRSPSPSITVWSSTETNNNNTTPLCMGEVSVLDILLFLCRLDQSTLSHHQHPLQSPVSALLNQKINSKFAVRQLEPNASLLEAVDCILEGAQSLVVPRRGRSKQRPLQKSSYGRQFCVISQEDVVRFFFNSINLFSSIASQSVSSLNIIEDRILAVNYDDPALSALTALEGSDTGHTSVAVLDDEGRLVGELSLNTLASCDESFAPAVAALSAGDLIAYIDYGGPSDDLMQLVKERLEERNLHGMLELLLDDHSSSSTSSYMGSSASSSSDDEVKSIRQRSNSGQFLRGTEPIVCHPRSSLIAVMIQALSLRLNHVWVVEEDYSVVGVVTFSGILKVFRDHLHS